MALSVREWHIIFDCDGTILDTSSNTYQLYPGIRELLSELSEIAYLYVWTLRDKQSTTKIFSELGIISFFDEFSNPEDGYPKPHTYGLQQLTKNIPKKYVLVVGDSSNDIIGAKDYGVESIGVIWNKAANRELLQQAGANFIVSHPADCSKIIQLKLNSI